MQDACCENWKLRTVPAAKTGSCVQLRKLEAEYSTRVFTGKFQKDSPLIKIYWYKFVVVAPFSNSGALLVWSLVLPCQISLFCRQIVLELAWYPGTRVPWYLGLDYNQWISR